VSGPLKDILLENEQIIWSGAPNYDRAKPERKFAWITPLLWAVGLALVTAGMFWAAQTESVSAFLQGLFGAVTVILLLIFFAICLSILQSPRKRRPKERYALTNQRLIVANDETGERSSYFADSLMWFKSFTNGAVRDLSLMMVHTDEEYIVLRALDDADKVENLLIQYGIARRPKS